MFWSGIRGGYFPPTVVACPLSGEIADRTQAGWLGSVYAWGSGGYQLARSPAQISLGQILEAVGEWVEPFPDAVEDNTPNAEDWVTIAVWKRLQQHLKTVLYGITLEDLYYDARSWQAAQGAEASFTV